MKRLRQFCAAFVLTLSLGCSVFGGEILLPGVTVPDHSQTPEATETTTVDQVMDVDPLMELAFGFWLNVSSLL